MTNRTDAQWVHDLENPDLQVDAYTELGNLLSKYVYFQLTKVAPQIPKLNSLSRQELENFAQDVVQESLIRIYKSLKQYNGSGTFGAWTRTIAYRMLVNRLRKKHWANEQLLDEVFNFSEEDRASQTTHEQWLADDKPLVGDQAILNEMMQVVLQTLEDHMTYRRARAFELRYFENRTTQQIAEDLDCSPNAVNGLVFQARKKIKHQLNFTFW